jgi:hypothetical protein
MDEQPLINPSLEMNRDSKVITVTQEDKERFFKSILSDQPYIEELSLFDGQYKIKLKSLSVQENTDVVNQIVADKERGVAADNDAYFITISTYRLSQSLISINGETYSDISREKFSSEDKDETYVLARAKAMTQWSTAKLSLFLDAFSVFESRLLKLTNEVQTVNFWKASA